MSKSGKIIPHSVKPEPHELETILYFTNLGKTIELIPESHTPGVKSPDFWMDGLVWEAKSPIKGNRRTVERIFYTASQQACNIIIDLRRLKSQKANDLELTLEKLFRNTRKVKKLYIITKPDKLTILKK